MKKAVLFFTYIILFILSSCSDKKKHDESIKDMQDDTINIVTLDIPYSHYIFNNQDYGYHYELIEEFTEKYKLNHKIIYTTSIDSIYYYMDNDICQLAAYNILPKNEYYACGDTLYSPISIISNGIPENECLNGTDSLTVYTSSSQEAYRVKLFAEETGYDINICVSDSDHIEILFSNLSEQKIPFIACYRNISNMMKYEYPEIGNVKDISLPYKLSWCTTNKELADTINHWYNNRTRKKTRIMHNYSYLATKGKRNFRYINKEQNIISNYDELFKRYAKMINWDWKLLAALSYTESNFDPEQISASGAIGLMQMMSVTAKAAGIPKENLFIPEDNLKTCIVYIKSLQKSFSKITDKAEQTKFVLGAYNSGLGHIYDAMALARKHNENDSNWDTVVKYLLLKNKKEYYEDPVCKYGSFNGQQTKSLVNSTLNTYNFYTNNFK